MASNRKQRLQEVSFKVLRIVEDNPSTSTRKIAREVGISNGAAYYCVNALIEKGFIKLKNFAKSDSKKNYIYELTPSGIRKKAAFTLKFLERKRLEYIDLKAEIERLEKELVIHGEDLKTDDGGIL